MELVFCCEGVFKEYNGKIYSGDTSFSFQLWQRYLSAFSHITVVARVEKTEAPTPFPLDNPDISFISLPRYQGLKGTIKARPILKKILKPLAVPGRCYILRAPGQIAYEFSKILKAENIPYAVEVVGDPWDVMESIGGVLTPVLKRVAFHQLNKIVKNAATVLYVTREKLQSRYPVRQGIQIYAASDVKITTEFLSQKPHTHSGIHSPLKLLAVGSLAQLYKAPDIVLKAMAKLKDYGISSSLTWLGDGIYREEMEKLSQELSIDGYVDFKGNVDRSTLEQELTDSDIFIHISRTEGLPRAIVEAMAKGLPVIGSAVGGIPELISAKMIVPPDNVEATVAKIIEVAKNEDIYNFEAERNLKEANSYEDNVLTVRRNAFYNHVKNLSAI